MQTAFDLETDQPGAAIPSFVPTREHALASLHAFIPKAGKAYAGRRNFDLGPGKHAHVSCLSPYLRLRLITEAEVVAAALGAHSFSTAEKFVQEVFWRTYFKGWLEHRPAVWTSYLEDVARLHEDAARGGLKKAVEEATTGHTGIECFDAWTNELIDTGYLHNHARMWYASIWIFTLNLPWQLGADFFLTHLLDGDPASNTLSWRWVGGLHTKGKHYLARASNINKFTEGRFNPGYQLANSETPSLNEEEEFDIAPLAAPVPVPAGATCGLLLTMEDCHPESLTGLPPLKGLAMADGVGNDSEIGLDEQVKAFRRAALDDLSGRAAAHFEKPVQRLSLEAGAAPLVDWASQQGIDTIVTPFVPQGPVHDQLEGMAQSLRAAGLTLALNKRDYDQLSWPHAKKGFFGLKKKIPDIVRDLEQLNL
ncbi:MAG: FAD-binding domain-containing protein [Pseudomonadota bacterium]